jgi:putative oxidoreductase
MMKPFVAVISGRLAGFGPLVLRLMLGWHLIHGTQDNVFSWARMLEFRDFLASQGFPFPLVSAVVSVCAQFLCGLLFAAGFLTRWAALVMVINFCVALTVHIGQPYAAAFPAWMMLTGSLALFFTGAGAWSFDSRFNTAHPKISK